MKRILFLMSDTGGGHRSSAEAVAAALASYPDCRSDVIDVITQYAPFPFNRVPKLYLPMINYASIPWGWVFHGSNRARSASIILRLLYSLLAPGLRHLFRDTEPDLVVSCHPLYTHVPRRVLRELDRHIPFVTIVTDLVSGHRLWFCPDVDLCIVPADELRALAESLGVAPTKIRVAGVPVHPKFLRPAADRETLRRELGLDPTRTTLLLVGGGEGMGQLFAIATVVARAGLDLQLVVIAGRNRRLRARLEQQTWPVPVHVYGFVNHMAQLMHASDAIITKAGPSTLCEAFICGRPILLSGFIPGQEEGNVRYVLDHGAGLLVPTPDRLVTALRDLLRPGNPALAQMAARSFNLGRPDAAQDIAAQLVELLGIAAGRRRGELSGVSHQPSASQSDH